MTITETRSVRILGLTFTSTRELTKCDDCGEMHLHTEMHHDESGHYCDDCRSAWEGEQHALYAPRSAVLAPVYCSHGAGCTYGEHCTTL